MVNNGVLILLGPRVEQTEVRVSAQVICIQLIEPQKLLKEFTADAFVVCVHVFTISESFESHGNTLYTLSGYISMDGIIHTFLCRQTHSPSA